MSNSILKTKFRCTHVEKEPVVSPYVERQVIVTLQSVHHDSEEETTGTISLSIVSSSISSRFEKGRTYSVDFTPIPPYNDVND